MHNFVQFVYCVFSIFCYTIIIENKERRFRKEDNYDETIVQKS